MSPKLIEYLIQLYIQTSQIIICWFVCWSILLLHSECNCDRSLVENGGITVRGVGVLWIKVLSNGKLLARSNEGIKKVNARWLWCGVAALVLNYGEKGILANYRYFSFFSWIKTMCLKVQHMEKQNFTFQIKL